MTVQFSHHPLKEELEKALVPCCLRAILSQSKTSQRRIKLAFMLKLGCFSQL